MERLIPSTIPLFFVFLLTIQRSSSQTTTTTSPPTSTTPAATTTTEATSTETTTPFSFLTTLATADSAATTVATFEEATTEGQASNDAASGVRPFRFESARNRPSANQEAAPPTEPTKPPKQKTEEKKIAWKFGRGGGNTEGWSVRPAPNSGYPLWKKEPPSSPASGPQVEQGADTKKTNDQQAYIVWSVGQGNPPNGWALNNGAAESWPPGVNPQQPIAPGGAWAPAGATGAENVNSGAWSAEEWTEDQSSDEDESGQQQEDWPSDEPPSQGNEDGQYAAQPGWAPDGQWTQQQAPVENAPPQNGWSNGNNAQGWNGGPPASNGGWVNPQQQQGNGWAPQQGVPPQGGGNGGWQRPPGAQNGGWSNAPPAPANGGWSNGQGGGGWNAPQDVDLSWKVYNEDTKTMENIDDSSGWKVVDDGADGWKLVDENGNVEWKIENVNGEWKVTSADDLPKADNSTTAVLGDAANATAEAAANATTTSSEEVATTTGAPNAGWDDDDKQGRYVVWKFSENGKGEAKVYGGGGAEPEVWTIGDNNQYWKETLNAKNGGGQQTWTADDGGSQGGWDEGSWQNSGQQPDANSWQQQPQANPPAQNNGWQQQSGGGAPQGAGWKTRGAAPATKGWQSGQSRPKPPAGKGRGWQSTPQNAGNGWKQQKQHVQPQVAPWSNNAPAPPGGWQSPAPPAAVPWSSRPQQKAGGGGWQSQGAPSQNGGWKNAPASQPGWQNGPPAAPPQQQGWAGGKNKGRTKGRWRNGNANGGRSNTNWQQNKAGNARKNSARGGQWSNQNRGSWSPGSAGAPPSSSWNNGPPPSAAPPTVASTAGPATWQGAKPGRATPGGGWANPGKPGQTVPYIIVIKAPDEGSSTAAQAGPAAANGWANNGGGRPKAKTKTNKPNRNNRRSSGWKMNRAGSSGWQWNPQGGSEGWRWMDGWMGSGGGFGGWVKDKDTMYSAWKPTKGQQPATRPANKRVSEASPKKNGSKMVFVFGTKKSSQGGRTRPNGEGKKGKQVIILDYTTAGKKVPTGDDGMKKDIESVIQALKSGRPKGDSSWKESQPQQWN